jgi:hypothetical protein
MMMDRVQCLVTGPYLFGKPLWGRGKRPRKVGWEMVPWPGLSRVLVHAAKLEAAFEELGRVYE